MFCKVRWVLTRKHLELSATRLREDASSFSEFSGKINLEAEKIGVMKQTKSTLERYPHFKFIFLKGSSPWPKA